MAIVLSSRVLGASVITDKGLIIGRLQDVLVDEKSGHIQMLVVNPAVKGLLENFPRDESGNCLLPYNLVVGIKDSIMVSEEGVLLFKGQTKNLSFK
jgi:sporulation protein YlmC with PRC-barrel domain